VAPRGRGEFRMTGESPQIAVLMERRVQIKRERSPVRGGKTREESVPDGDKQAFSEAREGITEDLRNA